MFRTELKASPDPSPLPLSSQILTAGSCFSDCMGRLLHRHKFHVLTNPFGTVYNPLSMHKLLRRALESDYVMRDELVEYQEIYSHYDFHSEFSGTDPDQVTDRINTCLRKTGEFLKSCEVIILTYGTAFVYYLESDRRPVSNCHKHPGNWFDRELLTPDQIADDFLELSARMPDKRFILTVSPVRHTRDTLPGNSVSKSILRYATHRIVASARQAVYFPSFEIMQDDLRDYRFYEPDMIHPSGEAEFYIWEKFLETFISREDRETLSQLASLLRKMEHRPRHTGTRSYRRFVQQTLAEAEALHGKMNLNREISQLRDQWEAIS